MKRSMFFLLPILVTAFAAIRAWEEPNEEPPRKSFSLGPIRILHPINGSHEGRYEKTPDGVIQRMIVRVSKSRMPGGRMLPRVDGADYGIEMIGESNLGYIVPMLGPQATALYEVHVHPSFEMLPPEKTPVGKSPQKDSYCIPYNSNGQLRRTEFLVQKAYLPEKETLAVAEVLVDLQHKKEVVLLRKGDVFTIGGFRYHVRDVVARDGKAKLAGWLELDPFGLPVEEKKEAEPEKKAELKP